ncbi:Translation initiation factor IF-2 [Diplonema papillatum]|nr:Translation initiation factor IF-2 [Diplonema papillatum]
MRRVLRCAVVGDLTRQPRLQYAQARRVSGGMRSRFKSLDLGLTRWELPAVVTEADIRGVTNCQAKALRHETARQAKQTGRVPVEGLYPFLLARDVIFNLTNKVCTYREVDVLTSPDFSREAVLHRAAGAGAGLVSRPPLIALLGHVDHGKTTLLEAWSGFSLAEQEPGSITQTLRAYNVPLEPGGPFRQVTVLDTPGHKLHRALREKGSFAADVCVLVIDVTEGVKRQTREAVELIRELGKPCVVALTKVDAVRVGGVRDAVAAVCAALERDPRTRLRVTVRTASTVGQPLGPGIAAPAIPVASIQRLQTDLVLREAVSAVVSASRTTAPGDGGALVLPAAAYGRGVAVVLDARHAPDSERAKTGGRRNVFETEIPVVSDGQNSSSPRISVSFPEKVHRKSEARGDADSPGSLPEIERAYDAAFAPDRTAAALHAPQADGRAEAFAFDSVNSPAKPGAAPRYYATCVVRQGLFSADRPRHWVVGRDTRGETTAVFDDFGRELGAGERVGPGEAFQIGTFAAKVPPAGGCHLIEVASRAEAVAVLQHRGLVAEYLRRGGAAELLTPEGSPHAYYWLADEASGGGVPGTATTTPHPGEEGRDPRRRGGGGGGGEEFSTRELAQRALLCAAWDERGACDDPGCRKAHPPSIATEPPQLLNVILAAESANSLAVITALLSRLSDKVVAINVVRSHVGGLDLELIHVASVGGPFTLPVICFRVGVPLHMIPIAVTQKVDVFDFEVFTEVARCVARLSDPLVERWKTRQRDRWERHGVPVGKRNERASLDKRAKRLRSVLVEEDDAIGLHDIYADSA